MPLAYVLSKTKKIEYKKALWYCVLYLPTASNLRHKFVAEYQHGAFFILTKTR